ncbi:MAG: hypothetical protein AAGD25_29245 [Cyanobacteria bacterium P01_F01_bin.150]
MSIQLLPTVSIRIDKRGPGDLTDPSGQLVNAEEGDRSEDRRRRVGCAGE